MSIVAYLANQFPSPVEPYVVDEIRELRRRGIRIIPGSVRRPEADLHGDLKRVAASVTYLWPLHLAVAMRATSLVWQRRSAMRHLLRRTLLQGKESAGQRLRALVHTWLGAYYAVLLEQQGVDHIHAHHGYFASWIALVAARLLECSFSLTLHGSDVLLHPTYLDTKLGECKFCFTVSQFNRRHILEHYPAVDPAKVLVQRLGVARREEISQERRAGHSESHLVVLAVGRLHAVKDHAFLVRACRRLKKAGAAFTCLIAGEGPERAPLERLIRNYGVQDEVQLLGHVPRNRLDAYYAACDLVVLTSRSEGIPLALMEAMSHGKLVLAPDITGIPELVIKGETGFLYRAGSLADFVAQVQSIGNLRPALGGLQRAARQHVLEHFDRDKNLAEFSELFLARIAGTAENEAYENPLLQQVQL
jgi:colanic acid/amylovoran biosynthesis glycosyltransferase